MKTTNYNPIIKLIDDYVYEIQGTRNVIKECLENPAFKEYKGKFKNDLEIKLHESFFYGTPYSGGGRSPMPPAALFMDKDKEVEGQVSELDKALKQIDTLDGNFTKNQVMNLVNAIPAVASLVKDEPKGSPLRQEGTYSLAKAFNKLENILSSYEEIIKQVRDAKRATGLNAGSAEAAIGAGLARRTKQKQKRAEAEAAKKAEVERITAQLEPEIAAYEKKIAGKKGKVAPEDMPLSRADAEKALRMADEEDLARFEKDIKEPGKVIRFLKFLGLTEQVSSRKLSK